MTDVDAKRHAYAPGTTAPVCRRCGREREHSVHWLEGRQT